MVELALAHTEAFRRDLQQLVVGKVFHALLERQNRRRYEADGGVGAGCAHIGQSAFSLLRGWFNAEKEEYDNGFDKAAKQLEYAFDFMESAFAGGQELVVFITELNTSSPAVAFLQEYSCERYYRYNKELLFRENTRDILERIRQLG